MEQGSKWPRNKNGPIYRVNCTQNMLKLTRKTPNLYLAYSNDFCSYSQFQEPMHNYSVGLFGSTVMLRLKIGPTSFKIGPKWAKIGPEKPFPIFCVAH